MLFLSEPAPTVPGCCMCQSSSLRRQLPADEIMLLLPCPCRACPCCNMRWQMSGELQSPCTYSTLQCSANGHLGSGRQTQPGFCSGLAASLRDASAPDQLFCPAETWRSTLELSLMLCWTRAHWTRSCVGTRQTTMWVTCCRKPAGGALQRLCPALAFMSCVTIAAASACTRQAVLRHQTDNMLCETSDLETKARNLLDLHYTRGWDSARTPGQQ